MKTGRRDVLGLLLGSGVAACTGGREPTGQPGYPGLSSDYADTDGEIVTQPPTGGLRNTMQRVPVTMYMTTW